MNKKILVVDDDFDILELFKDYLENNGFEIFMAENGKEGLKAFRKNKVDLVITDIRMPEMNGIELLKAIKNINPKMPVIVMTGFIPTPDQEKSMTHTADDYLLKPFPMRKVRSSILGLLAS